MSLRDSELTLKNEIIQQRRLMSNYKHECVNERMIADQLRDKNMILDNEASIKAVMENFKEKNLWGQLSTSPTIHRDLAGQVG